MLLSALLNAVGGAGGGRMKFQEFKTSGVFMPPSALVQKGGECILLLVAGGQSGYSKLSAPWTSGGQAGEVICKPIICTEDTVVQIGAGGAGDTGVVSGDANISANNGSDSSFGSIVAIGGGKTGCQGAKGDHVFRTNGSSVGTVLPAECGIYGFGNGGSFGRCYMNMNAPYLIEGALVKPTVANKGHGGSSNGFYLNTANGNISNYGVTAGSSGYALVIWSE